jgi:hypothetical protein
MSCFKAVDGEYNRQRLSTWRITDATFDGKMGIRENEAGKSVALVTAVNRA